jgi:ribosomal protein L1
MREVNMARPKLKEKKVRTTVTLPKPIYEEARAFVEKKADSADSLSSFFVAAIVAYVKLLKRKQIDAQFAAMRADKDFQKEAHLIAREFGPSDWEAFEAALREA